MQHIKRLNTLLVVFTLVLAALASACGPTAVQPAAATPTATTVPPTATLAPTETPLPPTETPTATPVPPTETPLPTATPELALVEQGLTGWCLPENTLISAASDPLSPPETARLSAYAEDGALEIRNLPWSSCVFMYTFNQTAPSGLKLEVYELGQKNAWLKADLQPVAGKAEAASTLLTHTYIITPPLWNVSYEFSLKDASGKELARNKVNLYRWETGLCWQGIPPDPITLYCPLQQDLHPWDPGYGKVLPTVTPRP